ncbi:MAG: hypothetical protein NXI07_01975, partial [bacterium]|nr:hypothetical protein [bacterium]
MDLLTPIIADASFKAFKKGLDAGQRTIATGSIGASISILASALHRQTSRPVLVVCAHVDEAEDILAETQAVGMNESEIFPALELAPGESSVSAELFANRAAKVAQIRAGQVPGVLIAPIAALMQPVPSAQRIDELVREIRGGDIIDPQALIDWLGEAGYERMDTIEYPGQFASRGGIIDIYPTSGSGGEPVPVRLDFFGDELDTIAEIDLDTMGSDRNIEQVLLGAAGEVQLKATSADKSVLEYLSEQSLVLLAETFEVVEQGRGYYERISDGRAIFGPPAVLKLLEARFHALCEVNQFSAGKSGADALVDLPVETLPPFDKEVAVAIRELAELKDRVDTVILACGSDGEFARLGELLTLHAPGVDIRRELLDIRRGFIWSASDEDAGIGRYALVPAGQMLHRSSVRRRMQRIRAGRAMDTFLDIQPDDYVVHAEHGIARFLGLTVMNASGTAKTSERYTLRPEKAKKRKEDQEEYLTLEFAGRSRLHVPCSQIDLVQKYVGGFRGKPPLSSIGGKKWKAQKERVSESVKDLASEMLRVRAAREHVPGFSYPEDTPLFTEFEAEFPYDET